MCVIHVYVLYIEEYLVWDIGRQLDNIIMDSRDIEYLSCNYLVDATSFQPKGGVVATQRSKLLCGNLCGCHSLCD